jgi:hypothetical protein
MQRETATRDHKGKVGRTPGKVGQNVGTHSLQPDIQALHYNGQSDLQGRWHHVKRDVCLDMQRRAAATAELTVTLHHALQLRPSRGQTQIIGDLPLNKSLLLCNFFIAHQVWDQGACELPPGKQAFCSHLILIAKHDSTRKTRLVARHSNQQRPGLDYGESFVQITPCT